MIYLAFILIVILVICLVVVIGQDTYYLGSIVFKEEYINIGNNCEKEYYLHILVKKISMYETKRIKVTRNTFDFASLGNDFPIKL